MVSISARSPRSVNASLSPITCRSSRPTCLPWIIASSMRAPPAFSGICRFMPLCPSTAQSMPGTAASSLRALVRVADVHQRHHDLRAARAQAGDRLARRRGRIARVDAGGLERRGVVGRRRRADAEQADLDAGGVDDLVGVEQPLAVPAVEVRRQQRDAGLLGQLPQQRQADRQIALARNQRGRSHPPEAPTRAGGRAARSRPGRAACRRGTPPDAGRNRSPPSRTSAASVSARARSSSVARRAMPPSGCTGQPHCS